MPLVPPLTLQTWSAYLVWTRHQLRCQRIQTRTSGQLFSKRSVGSSWSNKAYFSTSDQALDLSLDSSEMEMESYKLGLEEGPCILISNLIRRPLHCDFVLHLSIWVTDASQLEIPSWFFPVELLEGHGNTKTTGNSQWHRMATGQFWFTSH